MEKNYADESFKVWAHDNQVYGPVQLAGLIEWVRDGRVLKTTWIYLEHHQEWRAARDLEPLREYLPPGEATEFLQQQSAEGSGVTPQELRQVELLSSLGNSALAQLIKFGELQTLEAGEVVLKRNDPGDAVFFVLEGTLRARLIVGFEDRTLARISAGEVFGEMAMLTQSARSADVVTEGPVRLLRLSAASFHDLIGRHPEAAAPILLAIARMMACRIQEQNSRFQRDVASEFLWR